MATARSIFFSKSDSSMSRMSNGGMLGEMAISTVRPLHRMSTMKRYLWQVARVHADGNNEQEQHQRVICGRRAILPRSTSRRMDDSEGDGGRVHGQQEREHNAERHPPPPPTPPPAEQTCTTLLIETRHHRPSVTAICERASR
jgi:hypothetical protein